MLVCHLWPGLTPFNVWDLPLGIWIGFAASADDYAAAIKKTGGGK